MTEEFHVDPTYVAGYAELTSSVTSDVWAISAFVRHEAKSDDYFSGVIMGNLSGVVDGYAESVNSRLNDRGLVLSGTSRELREAAWRYTGDDDWLSNMYVSDYPNDGRFQSPAEFPDAHVFFHDHVQFGLNAPAVDEDGGSSYVMEDAGTDLAAINEVVDAVTSVLDIEFDLVGTITDPITGNWNALAQKGDVLVIAGDAAEDAADNLANARSTLLSEWDGGAAQAFESYIDSFVAALRYEGPLNRAVGEMYGLISEVIKEAARAAISVIGTIITKVRQYVMGTGTVELIGEIGLNTLEAGWDWITGGRVENPLNVLVDAKDELVGLYEDAKALIDALRDLPGNVETFMEAAEDPMDAHEGELGQILEDRLEPVTDRAEGMGEAGAHIQVAQHIGQITVELPDLADVNDLRDAPDESYEIGEDPWRDG